MFDAVISKNSQHHGNSNAVVSAKGRSVRSHPAVLFEDSDGFCEHVDLLVRLAGQNHINVSLKSNRFRVFASFRRLLGDDHIVGFILYTVQSSLIRESDQKIADLFGVMGSVRDRCDLPEIVKDALCVRSYIIGCALCIRFCCLRHCLCRCCCLFHDDILLFPALDILSARPAGSSKKSHFPSPCLIHYISMTGLFHAVPVPNQDLPAPVRPVFYNLIGMPRSFRYVLTSRISSSL